LSKAYSCVRHDQMLALLHWNNAKIFFWIIHLFYDNLLINYMWLHNFEGSRKGPRCGSIYVNMRSQSMTRVVTVWSTITQQWYTVPTQWTAEAGHLKYLVYILNWGVHNLHHVLKDKIDFFFISKTIIKVTKPKTMVPLKRYSHRECMYMYM
jgi:hypothetical protein